MTTEKEKVAYQTTEHHFTTPVEMEETTATVMRHVHHVPVDWFVATTPEYNLNSYEHYRRNPNFYPDVEKQQVKTVEFNYEREAVGDGTGKPYTVEFTVTADEESSAGREAGDEWTKHSRTQYLLGLLDYDEETYEVVRIAPTDERDGVLVTIQETLPHLPTE